MARSGARVWPGVRVWPRVRDRGRARARAYIRMMNTVFHCVQWNSSIPPHIKDTWICISINRT